MFASCRIAAPWRVLFAVAGHLGFLGLGMAGSSPAQAAAPRYPDLLPLSQVKVGMKGYALSTFKGSTITRFDITVVGILKKANSGRDLIMIRIENGPAKARGANLVQGMSGSPIYLKGKLIGALSMGEAFQKEPLVMVTPIEDMLDSWDPDIPQQPSNYLPADAMPSRPVRSERQTGANFQPNSKEQIAILPQPILVNGRQIKRVFLNARADSPLQSTPEMAVMRRATSLLTVSGLRETDRLQLQKEFDAKGYAITIARGYGGGGKSDFKGAPLRPGSAFGTWLSTGDVQIGGTGTITYRRGNRVLGFGHPLMSLGAMEGAISSASIIDILPSVQISHHIAVPGPIIGTLTQDRDFSVSGDIGRMPKLIPMDVTVRDRTANRTQIFHADVFQHPDLTPTLLRIVARQAVTFVHDVPGDVMAKVTTSVEASEVGKLSRTNTVYDAADISSAVTQDLGEITSITNGNPFYPLTVKRASMTIDIWRGHNTATIERLFLKQGRFEPGDTLEVGVVLKPFRRDPITRTLSLKIPSDTPTGRYALLVRGGAPSFTRVGSFVFSNGGGGRATDTSRESPTDGDTP